MKQAAEPKETPAPADESMRILHLEDDPNDAELVHRALEVDGLACKIHLVTDRDSFLASLSDPKFDLVLSDFSLPAFDGLSALRLVRERMADIPFLFVSGTIGEDAAIESLRSGATDYVLKHRLNRLVPAVRRALAETEERRRRQQLEAALSNDRHFLQTLLESLEVGTVACDSAGAITQLNRVAREFYGLHLDLPQADHRDVSGRFFQADGKTPLDKDALPLARALKGERFRNVEVSLNPENGPTRAVLVGGQPILDADGRKLGAVIVLHDITERKLLEGQLRQSQKMEAVGRLAGGIAHDFNNLLNVITGYGEMMSERLPQGDPLVPKVEQIRKAAQRAAALTRQLLAFSRKQMIEPKVLDLNALLADLDKMLRRVIGEDVEMVMVSGASLGAIKADPGQLEQIVMNLVVNARDAMPQGGCLTLETSNCDLDEAFVRRHAGARSGRYVMLQVSDTGIGMDTEVLSHIFEPFFTTKEKGKGTGLGLATVYGIVKQNEGYITVESERDKGTSFRIYLPRVAEAAESVRVRENAVAPRGSETVLVVEDEEAVRHVVREALRGFGYKVIDTGDPEECVRIAADHAGPIHLLVTDVIMPKLSGRDVADKIMAQRQDLKVLFMSGYTDNAIVQRGIVDSGLSFIQKPFALITLARKVRDVLDSENPAAEARRRRKRAS